MIRFKSYKTALTLLLSLGSLSVSANALVVFNEQEGSSIIWAKQLASRSLLEQLLSLHKVNFQRKQSIPADNQPVAKQQQDVIAQILPSNWFVSPSLEKAVLGKIRTQVKPSTIGYAVKVGLTQLGLRQIYNTLLRQFEDESLLELSVNQRKLLYWGTDQLAAMIASLPVDALPEAFEMRIAIEQLQKQVLAPLFPGRVVFENYNELTNLSLNDQLLNSNTVELLSGIYQFEAKQTGFYDLKGRVNVQPNSTQTLSLPFIPRPQITPRVHLLTTLDERLVAYLERALDSYGWVVDPRASSRFVVQMDEDIITLDQRQRSYDLIMSFQVDSPQYEQSANQRVLKRKDFFANDTIATNDQISIERERRVLMVQSLMQFLALFEQQDFTYLTATK